MVEISSSGSGEGPGGQPPGATRQADFHDGSYGYRPKRKAHDAVARVTKAILMGKTQVIDLDLAAYLDAATYCPPIHGTW
jgi:hypothetical protein